MFDNFPVRLLNRSIFVASRLADPRAAARMGWRAPVLAYVGLEPAFAVPDTAFTYAASLMDVTGTIRTRQELTLDEGVARRMRQEAPAEGRPQATRVPWEEGLAGLHWLQPEDLASLRQHLVAQRRDGSGGAAAFAALCGIMDRQGDESWQDFLDALEQDRFTASAWFERDRAHLGLRDEVLDCDVVSLWDEAVQEELDAGFLRAPRHPRPSDIDWLPHLVDFAQERSLIISLRADAPQPSRERNRP